MRVHRYPARNGYRDPEPDQRHSGYRCADAAEVVDPLTYTQAQNVQQQHKPKRDQSCKKREVRIVRQHYTARTEDEERCADEIQKHRRHVEDVVRPVAPTGEESMEVTKIFLRPQIDSAFTREAL